MDKICTIDTVTNRTNITVPNYLKNATPVPRNRSINDFLLSRRDKEWSILGTRYLIKYKSRNTIYLITILWLFKNQKVRFSWYFLKSKTLMQPIVLHCITRPKSYPHPLSTVTKLRPKFKYTFFLLSLFISDQKNKVRVSKMFYFVPIRKKIDLKFGVITIPSLKICNCR